LGKNLKFCQGNYYNQQDSLLWTSISPYSIKKFCAAADSVKRSDLKTFYQKKEINKSVQLYITGNFDQQKIIPLILAQADTCREKDFDQTILSAERDASNSLRMMFNPEYYMLSIQLPPVKKETILGELFLINAVKKYFLNKLADDNIKIYYPWSSENRELTVVIKRDAVEPNFVDNFRVFLVELNRVDEARIKEWYYNEHLIHIRGIYSDFNKNRRLLLMMQKYLNDAEYLFKIYPREEFPADDTQQALRRILIMNDLNIGFPPDDVIYPVE
ncbi:MAG: hypothetical protein AB7T22_14830, partial [Calditrichaceae bacterium]